MWICVCFFFSSRRRHTRWPRDWSSDVCSSDLDDLVAEVRLRVAQRLDLAAEIVNLKLDAVPAAWLRIAPVRHGLARSAGTGLVEQEAQVASREDRETGGVKLYTEAEPLGVERDCRLDVMDYVTHADRGHLWSSSGLVVVCYPHGGTEKGWVHRAKARFLPVPSYGFLRLRRMGSRRAPHSGLGQFGRFESRHSRESKTVRSRRGLYTGVRGRCILRTSPLRSSRKFGSRSSS